MSSRSACTTPKPSVAQRAAHFGLSLRLPTTQPPAADYARWRPSTKVKPLRSSESPPNLLACVSCKMVAWTDLALGCAATQLHGRRPGLNGHAVMGTTSSLLLRGPTPALHFSIRRNTFLQLGHNLCCLVSSASLEIISLALCGSVNHQLFWDRTGPVRVSIILPQDVDTSTCPRLCECIQYSFSGKYSNARARKEKKRKKVSKVRDRTHTHTHVP